ncbi:unnamed protein product [Phytophthora fragariaefolia]|uniref:Unnamed protein product n=1 Tax=Phytophthora fragariaefolia TaxID=1490495 RepID=A0A9W6Y5U1_9STRA|nr:unnamed protein product [Phytophthora fragariaefolia]
MGENNSIRRPILGEEHSTVVESELDEEFDKFVQIPSNRRISPQQNQELLQEITEGEARQAIAALNRHKAAGPDGLNSDFFKDAEGVLAPSMTTIGNELLDGGEPPPSFLDALSIPLLKKGYSTNAN